MHHLAVVIHAGLLKQVVIACGIIRQHREDELPLLCRAVYQQGFLQRNNRLLTLVICHKDTFMYFFVDAQFFKHLFSRALACKAIGRVE